MPFALLIKSLFSRKKKESIVKETVTDNSNLKETITDDSNLKCPNCKYDQWFEGPGGGSFGNIKCGGCGKWYNNLGPFGLREIKQL